MEIGFNALLLVCKYFQCTDNPPRHDTMLRLFVAATLVAYKLNFEIVSAKFLTFLSALIGTDTVTVTALERHFVKALNYDLQLAPHSLKKLIALLVQTHA